MGRASLRAVAEHSVDGGLPAGVEVLGLTKAFPRTEGAQRLVGIDGISFEVPHGSFFTLVGPSGCGKTTTLRCIAGLERADAGDIRIGSELVFSASHKRNQRSEDRPIALVPQSYGIWPHMTVLDNAAFPLRHGRNRVSRSHVKPRTMEMLERVGLQDVASRWATQLSGGQQQRLALARALLCDPDLLLLDEPLSNLDAKLRAQLRKELKSFQRDFGITTLYVTHDQSEALALSDNVAVLRDGRVEQVGSPNLLYDSPASAFVADFIGNANLVVGTLDAGASDSSVAVIRTALGAIRCDRISGDAEGAGGTDARTVCVRPEHVEVHASPPESSRPNVVEGRVISIEFLGDRHELIFESSGVQLRSYVSSGVAFGQGARVFAEIDPARAVCLTR